MEAPIKSGSNLYFLKTGNYLINFRGYFDDRKRLCSKLHRIINKSLKQLVDEWETKNNKKWTQKNEDIISNDDLCHSVHIFKIGAHNNKFWQTLFL